MMRFMLRDNQEAFIPLHKDLNYVNNYVEIQRMRLGSHPAIDLQSNLPDHTDPTLTIAPMLFIPFVENAFKHGISLQAHTYIHLHIAVDGGKLTFRCSNSTHDRIWLNDPEQHNHGIGLQNVRERLKLLYPDKHLLAITESDDSYTVELTLLLHNSTV
jgi:LytS/YehU family sensor histidine kinase